MPLADKRYLLDLYGSPESIAKLTKIDLSSRKLTSIDARLFNGLSNLSKLYLFSNELVTLDKKLFSGLSNLTRLNLDQNRLRSLDANIFADLVNLKYLNLSWNQLESLDVSLFNGLASLLELMLHTNQLDDIDRRAFQPLAKHIKAISVHNNRRSEYQSFIASDYNPYWANRKKFHYISNIDEFINQFNNGDNSNETAEVRKKSNKLAYEDPFIGKNFKNGKYKVHSKLGSGAFGSVYLTYDNTNKCERAIKVLRAIDIYEDDLEDIQLLKMINNEFIIKYFDHFRESYFVLVVLEYAKNGDLACLIEEHIGANREISPNRVFKWTWQAAQGLQALHSNRIVHRDIKPANLFLTSENTIKLGDLGVGKLIGESVSRANRSMAGTFPYMSPEMIREEPYSFNTDVWSLGCVVYELLFLKQAFPMIFQERNVDNLEFPESILTSLVKKMLKNNASERPTASNMCEYLLQKNKELFENDG